MTARARSSWPVVALIALGPLAASGLAQDGDRSEVSFHKQVRPLLQASCQGCHQPAKADGALVLTDYEGLLRGGKQGPAIVPGSPEGSVLIDMITPFADMPADMPLDRDPLTSAEIELFRRWVAEGAKDDTPPALRQHFTPENPPVYERPPVLTSLDYSPDGKLLAVSGYSEVLLHSTEGDGGLVARLVGLSERIESLAFSPDGTLLAMAGGSPARFGELQIWDVAKRELLHSVQVTYDTLYGVSWSHDGTRVAFGCSDRTLRAVDVKSGDEVLYQGAHEDWVLDTVFSTDSSHLVSVGRDRTMKLVKVDTQQFIDNITSITPGALLGGLTAVDRHPTRDELLVSGADGIPRIYKMYREKKRVIGDDFNLIRAFDALPGRVFDVRFSKNGEVIAAGSSSRGTGEVRVYRAADGEEAWRFEAPGGVFALGFHPLSDELATAGFDGMVRLFDAQDGRLKREFVPVPLAADTPAEPPAEATPIEATTKKPTTERVVLDARASERTGESR